MNSLKMNKKKRKKKKTKKVKKIFPLFLEEVKKREERLRLLLKGKLLQKEAKTLKKEELLKKQMQNQLKAQKKMMDLRVTVEKSF